MSIPFPPTLQVSVSLRPSSSAGGGDSGWGSLLQFLREQHAHSEADVLLSVKVALLFKNSPQLLLPGHGTVSPDPGDSPFRG